MRPTTCGEFEVAILCALPHEADAVKALCDETYDDDHNRAYSKPVGDVNVYSNCRIGEHNVVLCYMPGMGKGSAAGVASNLRMSYPGIQLALVVGICGAVPFSTDGSEIILGDVIISDSVIEYDFGRQYPDGFQRKHDANTTLGRPNREIRAVLSSLKTNDLRNKFHDRIYYHLQTLQTQKFSWGYPGTERDILYEDTYDNANDTQETGNIIYRNRLHEDTVNPVVHIGTIACADTVMKSGKHRDKLAEVEGVIGFEMEGAGVWDNLPCVIIKGVCDYADSNKNKSWQNYAAATGAAGAKAFLEHWRPNIRKGLSSKYKRRTKKNAKISLSFLSHSRS
jgi:nucleoside phosphorylase